AFRRDAEVFQHGADRLLGERRIAQAVAGSLQADHEAVADELVVARRLQRRDVLDARRRKCGRDRARDKHQGQQQATHHEVPTLIVPSGMMMPTKTAPLSTLRTLIASPSEPGSSETPCTVMVSEPCWKITSTGAPCSTR